MIRVGLVDSGAAARHAPRVVAARSFAPHLVEGSAREDTTVDALGHGAALADVLCEEPRVSLCVARVFFDRLVTTAAQLAAALDWLTAERVVLVNVSAGLREDRDVLRSAVERAQAAGALIVAAAPARGAAVFPAAYPSVVRATGDARCAPGEVSWLATEHADFGAHVAAGDVRGASAGCARVSARLARLLADGLDARAGLAALRANAKYVGPERREI